ncbi:MAG: M18 family aminopeptidase [Cellvibrionaceae bacterium]|nr:M18 family aminopeptidase [Cellvibrionaceae bacterium]MAZ90301.1 M18 family aminopeptidase [Cellvibrionaceae bacterium]|tara:strand:- start:30824 stop:32146 length:1323 start_codon:yes stop_codon:yes gene_type:complete
MSQSNFSKDFNQRLLSFLAASPTPFHAVESMSQLLEAAGFQSLSETDHWDLNAGEKYYVCRNDSSIIAFVYGQEPLPQSGIRMVGAHTDSPCLKVKPQPELTRQGYFQLGVETYGGVLLNPWFDRDLSLAGRVSYRNSAGAVTSSLINFERAIATIPSLAIHLDREANKNRSINSQKDIPPVLMQVAGDKSVDFRDLLKGYLIDQGTADVAKVLDYDLSFYDTQTPEIIGWNNEFVASARLDNLLSCFIGLEAILAADGEQSVLLMCNDHEEVGSRSACGAQGPMLADFLSRLLPDAQDRLRTISHSLMVSADNAHGIHPNFSDKHDGNHGPLLNKGPVIKVNANQSYATNSETSALFRHWAELADVTVQAFVTRTDMGCGSTIGPITAAEVGVRTLDIGVPTFGMHSIRELAGVDDAHNLFRVLMEFFKHSASLGDAAG